jgi:putative endonuclease
VDSKKRIWLGKSGEDAAAKILQENGMRIIARNYRTKMGEIDIIARDKDVICFVEVKARSSSAFGLPAESITAAKRKRLQKLALYYLKEKHLLGQKARFDVVSVRYSSGIPETILEKGAFCQDE